MMIDVQRTPEAAVVLMAMASGAGGSDDHTARRESGKAAVAGRRILIVEDEALVAMSMEQALIEAGYDVLAIVDTEGDAVAAADRLRPDIILMDVTLRNGSGLSAARMIRKSSPVRVIFVTGTSDRRTEAEAAELGAALIRKPFIADEFAARVRALTPSSD